MKAHHPTLNLLALILMLTTSLAKAAATVETETVLVGPESAVAGQGTPTTAVYNHDKFMALLQSLIGDRKAIVVFGTGYSAAGYADLAGLKDEYTRFHGENSDRAKEAGQVYVTISGGTTDGFGATFNETIPSDAIRVGIVAKQAMTYRTVVMPHDLLFLVPTFITGFQLKSDGTKANQYTWEVKQNEHDISENVRVPIELAKKGHTIISAVHGGADIAIKENLELLHEWKNQSQEIEKAGGKLQLQLHVGWDVDPSEKLLLKGKDKGFRGPEQLAQFLIENPTLGDGVDVQVRIKGGVAISLREYSQTQYGLEWSEKFRVAKQEFEIARLALEAFNAANPTMDGEPADITLKRAELARNQRFRTALANNNSEEIKVLAGAALRKLAFLRFKCGNLFGAI